MSTGLFDNSHPAKPGSALPPVEVIFGRSTTMQALRQKVESIAVTDVPALIQGESGTGKEVLAEYIHARSPRKAAAFIKITCPAIPGTLLESELFGYERGAFTGAFTSKRGRVELADAGTLFLDEISEIDLTLQAKLLHFLQDGQFCRIGAQQDRRVNVRLLCATNRQLESEVQTGGFRQDLFYRINVVSIQVPPLRERKADIPALVCYLLAVYNETYNRRVKPISSELLQQLQQHDWPGNIRQLENLIKRYVVLGSEEAVSSELRQKVEIRSGPKLAEAGTIPLKKVVRQAMQDFERKLILEALQAAHWNRKDAARSLNISYRTLLYKLRQASRPTKGVRKETPPPRPWPELPD